MKGNVKEMNNDATSNSGVFSKIARILSESYQHYCDHLRDLGDNVNYLP